MLPSTSPAMMYWIRIVNKRSSQASLEPDSSTGPPGPRNGGYRRASPGPARSLDGDPLPFGRGRRATSLAGPGILKTAPDQSSRVKTSIRASRSVRRTDHYPAHYPALDGFAIWFEFGIWTPQTGLVSTGTNVVAPALRKKEHIGFGLCPKIVG